MGVLPDALGAGVPLSNDKLSDGKSHPSPSFLFEVREKVLLRSLMSLRLVVVIRNRFPRNRIFRLRSFGRSVARTGTLTPLLTLWKVGHTDSTSQTLEGRSHVQVH